MAGHQRQTLSEKRGELDQLDPAKPSDVYGLQLQNLTPNPIERAVCLYLDVMAKLAELMTLQPRKRVRIMASLNG